MKNVKTVWVLNALLTVFLVSCTAQRSYDEVAYENIIDQSTPLLAKEEQGKKLSFFTMKQDTLSELYKKFKPQIDSVHAVKNNYIQGR